MPDAGYCRKQTVIDWLLAHPDSVPLSHPDPPTTAPSRYKPYTVPCPAPAPPPAPAPGSSSNSRRTEHQHQHLSVDRAVLLDVVREAVADIKDSVRGLSNGLLALDDRLCDLEDRPNPSEHKSQSPSSVNAQKLLGNDSTLALAQTLFPRLSVSVIQSVFAGKLQVDKFYKLDVEADAAGSACSSSSSLSPHLVSIFCNPSHSAALVLTFP